MAIVLPWISMMGTPILTAAPRPRGILTLRESLTPSPFTGKMGWTWRVNLEAGEYNRDTVAREQAH